MLRPLSLSHILAAISFRAWKVGHLTLTQSCCKSDDLDQNFITLIITLSEISFTGLN